MDDTTWGALAVVLTLLGGGYTYWAFTHRGAAAGTRGAAITVLPAAAWLTGTLKMFTRIVDAVVDWATRLVFSPSVWVGVGLAGLAMVLFVISGMMRTRGVGTTPAAARRQPPAGDLPAGRRPRSAPVVDDDTADIEAILRNRGIQ